MRTIVFGVTAIRDMGSPLAIDEMMQWRKKVSNGAILGPRIFAAGKLVDGLHQSGRGLWQ